MAKEIIDSVEKLEEELARVREAQRKFSTYTQEQVDKIFLAAAKAANMARIPLAKMAVEETGMGVVEDKIIKTTTQQSISIISIRIQRPAVLLMRIRLTAQKGIAEPLGALTVIHHLPYINRYF